LERAVKEFVNAGVSKFVIRPAAPPESWHRFAAEFAERVAPWQT
jgi:hypothetical protein